MALSLRPRPRQLPPALLAALVALAVLQPAGALALGLGAAAGRVAFGEPLRVAIPLLGISEGPPDAACFRLAAPAAAMDPDYVLRDGRIRVENERGQSRLVVAGTRPWRQPVVEFRIVARCGTTDVARDYLLLSALPGEPAVQPAVLAPAQPAAPAAPPVAMAGGAAAGDVLELATATNLNALARARYPNDRVTRDAYRRLMADANPELLRGRGPVGAVPLPAGTVLRLPPDLPPPAAAAGAAERTAGSASAASPPPAAAAAPDAAPRKTPDRLVIGGNAAARFRPLSGRELAAAMDRLERMVEDQGRTQIGMTESLKNVEIAFGDVRKSVLALEEKMQRMEVERARAEAERAKAMLRLAEEQNRQGLLAIVLAVLLSGATGAGLILWQQRLMVRREAGMPFPRGAGADAAAGAGTAAPASGFEGIATAPAASAPATAPAARPPAPTVPPPAASAVAAPAAVPPRAEAPPPQREPLVARQPAAPAAAPAFVAPPPSPAIAAVPVAPPAPAVEVEPAPMIEFELLANDAWVEPPKPTVSPAPTFSGDAGLLAVPAAFDEPPPTVHDQTLELAEVMAAMGLARGAVQTLLEHIQDTPHESAGHWLKLLDIYHRADLQDEFEKTVMELRGNFNVALDAWSDEPGPAGASLLEYRHLVSELIKLWGTRDCDEFLRNLISDTRDGTRAGFPRAVVEDILLLRSVLNEHLDGV